MSLDTSGLDSLVVDHLRTMLDPSKGGGLLSSTRTIRESTTHDFSQYRFFVPPDTERVAAFTGAADEAQMVDPQELLDAVPAFAAPFEASVLLGVVQHVPDRVSLYGRYNDSWVTRYVNRNTDALYAAWADAPLARQMHRIGFVEGLAPALLALYVELGAPADFVAEAAKVVTETVGLVVGRFTTTDVIDSEDIAYLSEPTTWHALASTAVAMMRTRLGAPAGTPSTGPEEPRVPVPLVYPFRNFRAGSLNFGIQLVYRQAWTPLGTQAGEIIRTLPLGPRQSERVTVEAVTRSKQTQTTEHSTSRQTTTEASSTTTDSSEVVREASEKFNWHAEISAGASYGFASAQLSAGMGGENASSSRDTKNRLNEAMEKTSSQLRQDTKIVVSTEAESSRSTSSVSEISNPNDEVAVTYVYSRLQRQYELHTYLASIATCVFYAEELPAPGDLTAGWIRKHDWILAKALLDSSFRSDLETVLGHEDSLPGADETDLRITKLMDTLTPGLPDPSGVSGTIPDLYASPQAAYERELERRRARQSQQRRYERSLARLQRHLYSNILHYMRAIWSQEDADSRLLRYSSVRVPIRWMFNSTQGGSMLAGEWVPDVRDEARDTAPLSEIIDPSGPIGYAGNYAVFALNGGLTYPGLEAALTDLRVPFLRHIGTGHVAQDSSVEVEVRVSTNRRGPGSYDFTWDAAAGVWVDASNPTRTFRPADGVFDVDALRVVVGGPSGPVAPKAGWTLHVEVELVPVLEDPELRSLRFASPAPPAGSEEQVYDAEVLAEHAEFFSDVAAAFARLPERPTRWAQLDAETRDVVRARWPHYQLRKRHTRRVLLDTNNVVLGRVVDPASSLEPFKAIHRYVDVVQAFEEAGQRRLENQRRQARLDRQMLGDPDIERVALVGGDASAVVDVDGPD